MRNRLKKCVLFAVSLSMLLSLSLTASASEAKPLESEKITVCNGDGQYIGEFDSMEEFESEFLGIKGERSSAARWLFRILKHAVGTYDVLEMVDDFTGIDINGWIAEHVILPVKEAAAKFSLYSVSGGITNPYPPHSYQYILYDRTNYYWVEE